MDPRTHQSTGAPLETTETAVASVLPSPGARLRLRPVDASRVEITGGLLGGRQQLNHEVTLRHGLKELERAGTIDNFRIAAGRQRGKRQGMVFSDSDVYKWLEAVGWELGRPGGAVPDLEQAAGKIIDLVEAAQEADGYLNTWCQINDPAWRWTDLQQGHELYCAGHLIQAAVAFARATGDTRLLGVARRFADLIDDVFRGGEQSGTDGHPEIEVALVELYRQTAEPRYLELAATLVERRGHGQFSGGRFDLRYYQDVEPVRESRTIVGHAVRALYLAAGVTDLYAETGDQQLLEAMLAQWGDLTDGKVYLTGGVGSRHDDESIGDPYELPPDRGYCETCASIASMMWNWRMLLVTGEARFADLFERTLYNGFLSGLALDGRSFFYVNPLQSRGGHARHTWDPVACCPPNIMRTLASLHHYLVTSSEHGVQVHQYTPSTIRVARPEGEVELRVATAYPWDGRVEIEVADSPDEEWTLALRIPAWARAATVDGRPVDAGGYAEVRRRWRRGTTVVLDLDVSPRLTVPNPRIDAIRGCLAIERGPVVYCVEQTDLPASAQLADVRIAGDRTPEDAGPVDALGGAPGIDVAGSIASLDGWQDSEYRDRREVEGTSPASQSTPLKAIPYHTWGNRGVGTMRVWLPEAD